MSDNLDTALKAAIKKALAEALAETVQGQQGTPPASQPAPMQAAEDRTHRRQRSIAREQFAFTLKSVFGVVAALATCGMIYGLVFAPELARATMHGYGPESGAWLNPASYKAAKKPGDEGCNTINAKDFDWRDLVSLDTVQEMVKQGALLNARPEDLAAIVIFHQLRKLSKGEKLNLAQAEEDFKNSLPCQWLPVYDAIKQEYPNVLPMPQMFRIPSVSFGG